MSDGKKTLLAVGGLIAFMCLVWFLGKACRAADGIANGVVADPIGNYEEYQNIFNTCKAIDQKIGNVQAIEDNEKNFSTFSKAQQISGLKQQLAKWTEEYNAKSKMWNRSLWKSAKLPYQLDASDATLFPNYNK